jgi:hypothetical protein
VAERVWADGALHSWRLKKKLAGEKRPERTFLSPEEKENWIEDFVQREAVGA